MKPTAPAVLGVRAPPPRPTLRGRLWLACCLSLAALPLLGLAEVVWRWLL